MSARRLPVLVLTAAVLALAVAPLLPLPAHGCSCAIPPDIKAWVDESEAAFVGTLIDKQDDGGFSDFGQESIYVFEVEEWVKGDAGEVIEVRSASDGAACGFEFWDDTMRIGAIIEEEDGVLRGGLCAQVDPDVLLAAMEGPTPSATGIAFLLAANGWSSTQLTVLDEVGAHVADLSPPGEPAEFEGTQSLDVCPGGKLMIQQTPSALVVWDLSGLQVVETYDVSGLIGASWIDDVRCREADASSIHALVGSESGSKLMEIVDEPTTILEMSGMTGRIGTDYVVSQQEHEGDATWIDLATGEKTPLTTTPPGELRAVSVATHPTDRKVAIVETSFDDPVTAKLSIVGESGEALDNFEIPWETYAPVWLDHDRVMVKAYNFDDWEQSFGFVFDLARGEMTEIEGWNAEHVIADGDTLYGVNGGSILTADLAGGEVGTLVTLPSQGAGPLILLDKAPVAAETTTTSTISEPAPDPTTPPLVAPELEAEEAGTANVQWIAGLAIAGFLGLLVWLGLRRPRGSD